MTESGNGRGGADTNFDQFKNTIKVNEITASGGTFLDGLRLAEARATIGARVRRQ